MTNLDSIFREGESTPMFLPGKSHGWRCLASCNLWGHEESDMTEQLHFHFSLSCIGEGNGNLTPVFLPGESQGRESLVGCRLWGLTWLKQLSSSRQHIKKQKHYFANKGPSSQGYGFSISHVWMWELDYKESLAQKNWCFWTVVLEKTLESPLDFKEIQPVHPKGDQSWVFTGGTDVEDETPILWPRDSES